GQSQLGRARPTADCRRGLDDQHRLARPGQRDGRGQPIRPGTDHDCVIGPADLRHAVCSIDSPVSNLQRVDSRGISRNVEGIDMFKADRPYWELAGRILISLIFLFAGIGKVMDWSGTAEHMVTKGMTAVPFFLTMAIL